MQFAAKEWRTDSPPYGKRPIWQYVWLQGSQWHSDHNWARSGWGTAGIRLNDSPDGLLGYRRADIERICRDNGIDIETAKVVGWLPMTAPAPMPPEDRPALAPCDDGEWASPTFPRTDALRGAVRAVKGVK